MAEKVGSLYYSVELDTGTMVRGQREVDQSLKKTTGSLDGFEGKLTRIASAIKVYAVALAVLKSAQLADDMRLLSARVEVAAGSVDAGSAAMNRLVQISRTTQTAVAGNVEVFTRLNSSILAMGGTQNDTLRITELLGKAIRVSGVSATEAKSAMIQFGQALGSGKLQGDELRSLMETAPYLMKQLADGLGVPIGALKKLGEEGKLTSDVVTNALGRSARQIEADFAKFPQTIGGALDVATDGATRAAAKLDELTGTSTVLTGATKGLGEVLDKLAEQLGAANTEAGKLGRNNAIKDWADSTKVALSYLVDAADVVWQTVSVLGRNVAFVFTGIGTEIGGVGAQIKAVMQGDFAGAKAIGDAMEADAEARRKELDAADAKTLAKRKLFGQQMREAWEAGAGGGRGFVNPQTAPSRLKSTGADDGKKTKFDSAAYLGGLESQAVEGFAKIDAIEQEALRKNAALLDKKKITAEQSARAITAIQQRAAKDRLDLQDGLDRLIEDKLKDQAKRDVDAEKQREENRLAARRDIAGGDPIEALRVEEEQKLKVVEEARLLDLENSQLYEDQRTAIKREAAIKRGEIEEDEAEKRRRIQQMEYNALSSVTDNILTLLQKAGKERTALGKAAFLASKAIAVAEILMNTEVAAQKAMGQLGIFGLPVSTVIRASGYASAGMVAGMAIGEVAGGRRYGGPASAGNLYEINEGGQPEMFTAGNKQYMMPTRSGQVTPADQVGGGVQWTINVNNAPPGTTVGVDQQARTIEIAVGRAVGEVASQISSNSGQVWTAMRGGTNVGPRL